MNRYKVNVRAASLKTPGGVSTKSLVKLSLALSQDMIRLVGELLDSDRSGGAVPPGLVNFSAEVLESMAIMHKFLLDLAKCQEAELNRRHEDFQSEGPR